MAVREPPWEQNGLPPMVNFMWIALGLLRSLMIGLKVLMLTFISNGEYGFTYGELMLFCGMGMEFKGKIMLYCFREVKCKQGFNTKIWY